ncbi:MAG: hypothetical protein IPI46_11630 [Bacteroidetes bacterium]|nr:hypothetical protein [Bacteroidota bacterium]
MNDTTKKQSESPSIKWYKSSFFSGANEKPFTSAPSKLKICNNHDPLNPVCPVKKTFFPSK